MSSSRSLPVRERSLSVVVPVLNEENNVEPTVLRLIDALKITVEEYEILIIDDGSTDKTFSVINRLQEQYPFVRCFQNKTNMGLGFSYVKGCSEAKMNFLVYIPGDNTWPYRSFVELFSNIGRADVITSYAINPSVRASSRRLVSKAYTRALNLLFNKSLHYYNGLTVYETRFLQCKPATTFGFGFQSEVLLKALATGASYIEVGLPIDERTAGGSKAVTARNIVSVAATLVRLFWDLRIRKKWSKQIKVNSAPPSIGVQSVDEIGLTPEMIAPLEATGYESRKVIVVTGGSSGIGHALAMCLASDGHQVFVCSRNEESLRKQFSSVANISFYQCDVSKEDEVKKFVAFVGQKSKAIDVLINCAGSFGAIGPIHDVNAAEWLQTIQQNLFGTFVVTQKFLNLLQHSNTPQVINFSGGGAFNPFPNYSAYACSKAAIVRLTETLAFELAHMGISVNAIAPGLIATKVHDATLAAGVEKTGPLQFYKSMSIKRPEEQEGNLARLRLVENCVRALISPAYRNLTGKTISANFDPWNSDDFRNNIQEISRSELYTMRRTNLFAIPDGFLRTTLEKAWSSHGIQK